MISESDGAHILEHKVRSLELSHRNSPVKNGLLALPELQLELRRIAGHLDVATSADRGLFEYAFDLDGALPVRHPRAAVGNQLLVSERRRQLQLQAFPGHGDFPFTRIGSAALRALPAL